MSGKANAECGILSYILDTGDLNIITKNGIDETAFQNFSDVYSFILQYYEVRNTMPSVYTVADQYPNFVWLSYRDDDIKDWVYFLREEVLYRKYMVILKKTVEMANTNMMEALKYLQSNMETFKSLEQDLEVSNAFKEEEIVNNLNEEREFITSGIEGMDNYLGGGFKKDGDDFVLVVGRTGVGKSQWLIKSALENCKQGQVVGFISPEMEKGDVYRRMATMMTGLSMYDINHEEVNMELLKQRVREVSGEFKFATLRTFNNELTIEKLRTFIQVNNINVLYLDGVSYISTGIKNDRRAVYEKLQDISFRLKNLSMNLKIPIICAVQANRGVDKVTGRVSLENVAGGDSLAQNATRVISVMWGKLEEDADVNERALISEILKNRYGVSRKACLYRVNFSEGLMRLEDGDFQAFEKISNVNSGGGKKQGDAAEFDKKIGEQRRLRAKDTTINEEECF